MDIRKFFGPKSTGGAKPKATGKEKTEKTQQKKTEIKTGSKLSKRKSSFTEKNGNNKTKEDEEKIVIDVDEDEEEVIEDSQKNKTQQNLKKTPTKPEKENKKQQKQSNGEFTSVKKNENSKIKNNENAKKNKSKRKNSNEVKKKKDNKEDKECVIESSEENDEEEPVVSRRKAKRKTISSDEEVIVNTDDEEEVLVSRRSKKTKTASGKKTRVLDSDSDGEKEEPAPKAKKRKKEAIQFVDDSDEETKKSTLDKFVVHKTTPASLKAKKEPEKKGTPVNVSQYFGASSASRSERQTSAKRKLGESGSTESTDERKSSEKIPSPESAKPATIKKGKTYTMEVTKTTPKKVEEKKEDETPKKPSPKPAALKKDVQDDDDGFSSKRANSFRAFKARGGPLALGSKEIPEGEENCLEGLTFVITGVLDCIERDDAKSLVEKLGGKVTTTVSKKTSYVVVGREPGESKLAKAEQNKVKQVNEDEFLDLIRTLPGKMSKYEAQARELAQKEVKLKVEKNKQEEAKKKLESFRAKRETDAPTSPTDKPFTQIKDLTPSQNTAENTPQTTPHDPKQTSGQEGEQLMWVDKHRPTSVKQIIGQQGEKSNARKLTNWLDRWHENILVKKLKPAGNFFGGGDGTGCRAALLSGPPGIGKTTTATLVAKELGFTFVELNASDTRSKRSLKEVVSESLDNQTLLDYMGSTGAGQRHLLIMDEVDGMAGNEDRGGLQELVQLIKSTKIPVICICNDRNSMKMRTLSNYCLDLRFQRPRAEQIKGAMMSLAFREGLKVPPSALTEIIQASNHDIRQIIHNLSMWSVGEKQLTFEQVKADAKKAQKNLKIGPFDVCRKVFVSDEETRRMSIHDKSDLFFQDYSFGPLFVHENYINVIPGRAAGSKVKHMSCLARTIDSICDGDLVDKLVRREGNWNLLPSQAMYASVLPGEIMRGSFPQMTSFPQWLGKFSSTNKTERILQELSTHMRLVVSCDKRGLNLDYLPALRTHLTEPLLSRGAEGVPEVIKVMDEYDVIKEDFDNMLEITKYPNSKDPMAKLESKTKAAFTRQYNKEAHMTPYSTGVTKKKRRGAGPSVEELEGLGEGEEGTTAMEESEEDEDDISADTMIKTKKPNKGKAPAGKGKQLVGKGKTSAKGKR